MRIISLIFYLFIYFLVLVVIVILFSKIVSKRYSSYCLNKYSIREEDIISDFYFFNDFLYFYTVSDEENIIILCSTDNNIKLSKNGKNINKVIGYEKINKIKQIQIKNSQNNKKGKPWMLIKKGEVILKLKYDFKRDISEYEKLLEFERKFFILIFNKKTERINKVIDLKTIRVI